MEFLGTKFARNFTLATQGAKDLVPNKFLGTKFARNFTLATQGVKDLVPHKFLGAKFARHLAEIELCKKFR